MREFMVYPDGDYFDCDEYDEHPSWKSDDFYILEIPEDVEDPEDYIEEHLLAVDLGSSCEKRNGSIA